MNNQQIEKGLKLCAAGAKEKNTKCSQCPYARAGCLSALLSDSLRYIQRLKVPQNRDSRPGNSTSSAAPNPRKQGKPVSEWLKEERERRARNGEKDCISLWDLL